MEQPGRGSEAAGSRLLHSSACSNGPIRRARSLALAADDVRAVRVADNFALQCSAGTQRRGQHRWQRQGEGCAFGETTSRQPAANNNCVMTQQSVLYGTSVTVVSEPEDDTGSDSGSSWWSYPSECGSVVELGRPGVVFAKHAEDIESLRSCFGSLEGDTNHEVTGFAIVRGDGDTSRHLRSTAGVAPPPDRPESRSVNTFSACVTDTGDTRSGSVRFKGVANRPRITANDQVRAQGRTSDTVRNAKSDTALTALRKSSLADDRTHAAPSIERHVTFKDLSASSSSDRSDDEACERRSPLRNRNLPGYHGDDKQASPGNAAKEVDLDDSGYLDGDSTSSSSDVSPPSSISWESAIDSSHNSRKAGGLRDSRVKGQQCFEDCHRNGLPEPEHRTTNPNGSSKTKTENMNGFSNTSTGSFVHTEISVSESVRREDSYEYYRNGTRVSKLNNVNQTSWSETSCTDSSEICTPVEKIVSVERQQTTTPPIQKAAAHRRVLPSLDVVRKCQPETTSAKHQSAPSAPRESERQKKESGGARNVGGVREVVTGKSVSQHDRQTKPSWDEGTSCDLEDDEESGSSESLETPSSQDEKKVRFEVAARPGTVSATATSRATARSRAGTQHPPSRASALASVRAQARDPFLALAVATAKAATTASAEASREIYSGYGQFSHHPNLDVVVRTSCSVGSEDDSADRARHARDQPDSGFVAVSSPYKVSSTRGDVQLPTPVRYKEFSSLQLKTGAADGGAALAREPLHCEQRSFQVHSVVLPSRADSSSPVLARSTPSPVLREDRVRVVRTPVKSVPVMVDHLPDSDDCDVTPTLQRNGIASKTKRPATLPVNGNAVYRKPPIPQRRPRSPPVDPEEHLERITGYRTARRLAQTLPKPQVVLPEQRHPCQGPGGRLVSSRRRFFENLQRQVNTTAAACEEPSERLQSFQASAQRARETLAKSSPDFAALEADAAWRSRRTTDVADRYAAVLQAAPAVRSPVPAVEPDNFRRVVEETRSRYLRRVQPPPPQDERRRSKSLGYLETDVDTLQCRQVKRADRRDEDVDVADYTDLHDDPESPLARTRSMDHFLEDTTNTTLGERTKSEHELRVERSLQKLQLPDWYTRNTGSETGSFRPRRDSSASSTRPTWQGLGSRTPSSTSLAPSSNGRNLVIPKRVTPDWRCWHTSRESLSSSPASPGGSLSRWGR